MGWRAALQRRTWGSWWTPGWTWASNVPLQQRPMEFWAAWGVLPAGCVRWSFPSAQQWWGYIWSAGSSSERDRTHWSKSNEAPQRWLRTIIHMRRDRAGTVQPGEGKAQERILSMCRNTHTHTHTHTQSAGGNPNKTQRKKHHTNKPCQEI